MGRILKESLVVDPALQGAFLETLQRTVREEVFAVDGELRYVYFNPSHARRMRESCGTAPIVGRVITDLIRDPGTRAHLFASIQQTLAGVPRHTVGWWQCGAAGQRAMDCTFEPVRVPGGGPVGVAVVMRELADPREDATAFKSLERRYEAILRSSPDGIAVLRPDGRILEANDAFTHLVGAPLSEVLLSEWRQWTADETPERALRAIAPAFDHEFRYETVIRRGSERFLAVEITAAPVQVAGQRAALFNVRDISDRHRRETEIAEREARLRTFFDNAPVGIGVADLVTGKIVEVNPAMCRIMGRSAEELRGMPQGDLTLPADREREAPLRNELLAGTRASYTIEKTFILPDGSKVPAQSRLVRLPDVLGRHPLVMGIATDLRELADAEQALRTSEEKYRRLTENAEDMIFRFALHPDRRIEYVSPAVRQVLGFTPEECYADPRLPFERIEPEDGELLAALLDGKVDLSKAHLLRWRHADGSLRWLEHRGRLVRDAEGAPEAIEGIARDVTDRVQSEERLRLLGRVVEQAVEGVMITDRAGRIQHVNEAFERITGYTRQEVIGLNPRVLKSGHQDQDFYVRMWTTLRNAEPFAAKVKNRRKDGSLYDAEINVSPVRDTRGNVTHYVGLQRDVTKEQERADQLRQSQKMEAMGQVTGGIAHDFNNLLTVILASAELIAPELPANSDLAHFNQDLMDAARHGSTLVRQLLAFGRRELLTPGPLDLGRSVGEFTEVLRRLLPETIDLPPVTGNAPIAFADRGAVEQMLLNLATNARDAMPDGGTLTIELGTRRVPEGFEEGIPETTFTTLTVRDTGSGMDETTKRRALEPFFTTKPTGKGTGLGLPMVLGTMQQLGGWVEIASAPGDGTAITLGFSLGGAVTATAEATTPRPVLPPTGHARILLVEDNVQLRRIATRTLEHLGYDVVSAEDGEAGWELWCTLRSGVDLVLTDAVMPKLSGTDLIRRIRTTGSGIPIVLASGYSSEDFNDLEGQVTMVAKPWTVETLREKLAGALLQQTA